jgi:hypothetical protein
MTPLLVGAYDPAAWSGLTLSDAPGRGFALRLDLEKGGERAEGEDLFFLAGHVGPNAGDARFARITFDTDLPFGRGRETPIRPAVDRTAGLTWEWARTLHGAVAQATAAFAGALELRAYFPWDWRGRWEAHPDGVRGLGEDGAMHCAVTTDPSGAVRLEEGGAAAVIRCTVEPGDVLTLRVALNEEPAGAERSTGAALDPSAIRRQLRDAAAAYDSSRVVTTGAWSGLAEAVTDNINWMVALQPELGRRYVPAGRRWIFPRRGGGREHWTIFCWDGFFNALELGLESPAVAKEMLAAVLETQYANGNIPNWRGRFAGTPDRSQPPVGSYAVLKCYLRTGDRSMLQHALPLLERWSAWWRAPKRGRPRRAGGERGLFQWGADLDLLSDSPPPWERDASDHQKAAWESGQDDLPSWDEAQWVPETETFDLDAVDLNSYLALDLECLAQIAAVLGDAAKEADYRARRDALVVGVNEHLWDEASGMYRDGLWRGGLSPRLAAANFLPLLAGIPSTERARRMVEVLLDAARFWGDYVVPTVSRDDPAFRDQQYWRGTVWPPVNYLLYQGLRRYRFDDVAAQLAERSVALFLGTWRRLGICPENFDSVTGEPGGTRYQSWGPLLGLIGVEEFLDVTPWDGLRVGSPQPPAGALRRVPLDGRGWTVELGPRETRVAVEGRALVVCDAPVVLRHLRWTGAGLAAEVEARRPTAAAFLPDIGVAALEVDGEGVSSAATKVTLAPGRHTVQAVAQEALV